jgi:hypothetical protein
MASRKVFAMQSYVDQVGCRPLDVACGTGQHPRHPKEHFGAEGLDLDPEFAENRPTATTRPCGLRVELVVEGVAGSAAHADVRSLPDQYHGADAPLLRSPARSVPTNPL